MLPQVLEKVLRARGLQVGTPQKIELVKHVCAGLKPPHAPVEYVVVGVWRIRALPLAAGKAAGEWYYVWRTVKGWCVNRERPTEVIERSLGIDYRDEPRRPSNF